MNSQVEFVKKLMDISSQMLSVSPSCHSTHQSCPLTYRRPFEGVTTAGWTGNHGGFLHFLKAWGRIGSNMTS